MVSVDVQVREQVRATLDNLSDGLGSVKGGLEEVVGRVGEMERGVLGEREGVARRWGDVMEKIGLLEEGLDRVGRV